MTAPSSACESRPAKLARELVLVDAMGSIPATRTCVAMSHPRFLTGPRPCPNVECRVGCIDVQRDIAIAEPLLGYRQDAIDLRKVLTSRYYFSRALLQSGRHALRGLLGQAAKATFDTVAITTGLERKLLRHRARPLSPSQVERWNTVWRSVSAPAVSGRTVR